MKIQSINPATEEVLKSFDPDTDEVTQDKVRRSWEAFQSYRDRPLAQRAGWLLSLAEILEKEQNRLGRLMAIEMGKPLASACAEAAKCAWVCRFYAENAERFLQDEVIQSEADQSYVKSQPLGPVLAIMPWNFPFWQVIRFAAPALMGGNTALLKHASNVPQCAIELESLFQRAGFPEGVFQSLLIPSSSVEAVIAHPYVQAVTLTGSEAAGSKVAEAAGRNLKKTVLELGGSDPFIVTQYADLEVAVQGAVHSRTLNNGQSCISAKRFFIEETIADEFEKRFVRAMSELRMGNPLEESTQIGPLATASIRESLEEQVAKAIREGAKLRTGGRRLSRKGFYFEPTVFTGTPPGSTLDVEEVFGPVAACFRVKNLEEALSLANQSRYGLGSSLWSQNQEEQDLFIERIEAGAAFINGIVASDPRLPFGGIKKSGYGRELGREGLFEFMNRKTVWMKTGLGQTASPAQKSDY